MFRLGRLQEAVSTFTKCLQLKPFFLDGLIARGNVFMDYGHEAGIKQARRDYERALRLDPMCLAARVNLAYTLQVCGKLMRAWRNFTIAITLKGSEWTRAEPVGLVCPPLCCIAGELQLPCEQHVAGKFWLPYKLLQLLVNS